MPNQQQFQQSIKIDILSLDEEWLKQPLLVHEYSQRWVAADAEMEQLKDELKLKRSEIYLRLREEHEGSRVTEANLNSLVDSNSQIIEINNKIHAKREELGVFRAARDAVQAKGAALENLVKLHGQQYFSTPNVKEAQKRAEDTGTQQQRVQLRRRSKKTERR